MSRPGRRVADGTRFGPWKYRADNLTLEMTGASHPGGSNPYYVDLEECGTPEGMLDWIFQIRSKGWGDALALAGLIEALDALLDPQANLCSFGARSVIADVKKHLRP